MIAAIHQPNYLPWLGYFAKMRQCDVFIHLDTVPFSRQSYTQRCRIAGPAGPVWLTVPVRLKGRFGQSIRDVQIAESPAWARKHWKTLQQVYRDTPYFADYAPALEAAYAAPAERLEAVNARFLEVLRAALGVDTPVARASELQAEGSKSRLLAALCRAVGATTYLSGEGARSYNDAKVFAAAGVELRYVRFVHPTYPQPGAGFAPGLSAVDALCALGPATAATLTAQGPGEGARHV